MAKAILDLGELDVAEASEAGAEIELVHPASKRGLGYFISVVGKDSQVFRDYIAEKANTDRRKAAVEARRGRPSEPTTYEEDDASSVRLLVLCCTGWRSEAVPEIKRGEFVTQQAKEGGAFLRYRGTNVAFNVETAIKFFSDPGMAEFRKQIDKAIVDVENFIKD